VEVAKVKRDNPRLQFDLRPYVFARCQYLSLGAARVTGRIDFE